jgi:hypothetical protein
MMRRLCCYQRQLRAASSLCSVANFLYFFVVLITTARGIANGMGSTRAMG